jgi:hypothetical protein
VNSEISVVRVRVMDMAVVSPIDIFITYDERLV